MYIRRVPVDVGNSSLGCNALRLCKEGLYSPMLFCKEGPALCLVLLGVVCRGVHPSGGGCTTSNPPRSLQRTCKYALLLPRKTRVGRGCVFVHMLGRPFSCAQLFLRKMVSLKTWEALILTDFYFGGQLLALFCFMLAHVWPIMGLMAV